MKFTHSLAFNAVPEWKVGEFFVFEFPMFPSSSSCSPSPAQRFLPLSFSNPGYINYKKLTALAYDAERHAAAAAAATAEGDERSARLSLAAASDAEAAFKRTLESERHKCLDFFAEKVRLIGFVDGGGKKTRPQR